ncbi:MAG: YceI family protein [Steroidobacteraceae bacterium]|nr:YceI family protein [Steroidobacteraceae bacterium]
MNRLALAFALTSLLASTAQAVEYNQLQADKSSIAFSYSQMGVSMDGQFRKFASQLSFDPAQVAKAKLAVDVDLASIDTGAPELDTEATGRDWFNIRSFPTARFVAASVKPLGGNRYSVAGKLTIKGRTKDIVVPATFTPQGNAGVFAGSFTIRRGDFSIGEGAWSAFDIVANDVQVRFRLTASSRK